MLIKSFVIILFSYCYVSSLPVQLSDNAKSEVTEVVDRSEQQFRLNKTEDELSPSDTLEGVTTRETKDVESSRKFSGHQSQPQIAYVAASGASPGIINPGIINPGLIHPTYYQAAPQKYSIFHKPNPVIYVVIPPTTTTTIRPTVGPPVPPG